MKIKAGPAVHQVNGYTIVFDAYAKSWLITKRGNIQSLGHRDLADATRWALAH